MRAQLYDPLPVKLPPATVYFETWCIKEALRRIGEQASARDDAVLGGTDSVREPMEGADHE